VSAPLLALIGVFAALVIARVPIAFAMIVAALAYLVAAGRDIGLVADQIMNTLAASYLLVAIPMFLLAANIMNAGSISDRLFAACHLAVGRVRGGLAQVDVLVSVLFASMSGSAVADAAGPGLVTIRAMEKAGYPRGFAAAIVAASAVLGPIIPPSIPLLLYALIGRGDDARGGPDGPPPRLSGRRAAPAPGASTHPRARGAPPRHAGAASRRHLQRRLHADRSRRCRRALRARPRGHPVSGAPMEDGL
jgi:hypothetical protein